MGKPEGVRIVKKNGFTFEPELRHVGVDEEGMDCWLAVFEGKFIANEDKLTVDMLPARTSLGVATSLPPGVTLEEAQARLSMARDDEDD